MRLFKTFDGVNLNKTRTVVDEMAEVLRKRKFDNLIDSVNKSLKEADRTIILDSLSMSNPKELKSMGILNKYSTFHTAEIYLYQNWFREEIGSD